MSPDLARRLVAAGVTSAAEVTVERLRATSGVSAARAERLARSWSQAAPAFAVADLLQPAGLPLRLAGSLVQLLGPDAAGQLAADPWRLLAAPEARPAQADALARRLEPAAVPADPRRAVALTAHVLRRAALDGHTAMPVGAVRAALAGLGVPDPAGALDRLRPAQSPAEGADDVAGDDAPRRPDASFRPVAVRSGDGSTLVALASLAAAEEAVASGLARLARTAGPLAGEDDVGGVRASLDAEQARAVGAVAAHGVSLLTGGPGTGKSRTVAAVVALGAARGRRVCLAAPTGRAAKRLEELTGIAAVTVHRLLAAQGAGTGFARGPDWPLDADLVVVDEASMLDVELAAGLLAACPDGTHLLLVGDPAQLPSVGPGRVLADLVDCGRLPVTELRTLYRQAEGGAIARLATSVRAGELPSVDAPDREVVVVPAAGSDEAARRAVQLVTDSIPRALGIAASDVQVVTPVHRGPAGTAALNAVLKAALNPGPGAAGGFDVGDRVVATANHLQSDGTGFANGEVGVVTSTSGGDLVVAFPGGPVTVAAPSRGDLRHGWAITVHRAQGSEWAAVVAVLPPEAAGLLSRPLVYTAFTRAQRHLSVVHAAGPALAHAVRAVGSRPRRTRLGELVGGRLTAPDGTAGPGAG